MQESQGADLDIVDISVSAEFIERRSRKRNFEAECRALHRLGEIFASSPETILKALTDTAMQLCGSESAGISLEENGPDGEQIFHWIAASGKFAPYLHRTMVRNFETSGICLDRNAPQLFHPTKPNCYFLGVEAPTIFEGLLIPWHTRETQGSLWAVNHSQHRKFDREDYRILRSLADFTAVAINQQNLLRNEAGYAATARLANELAHQINNSLQSATNALYLASEESESTQDLVTIAATDVRQIAKVVEKLLDLHTSKKVSCSCDDHRAPQPHRVQSGRALLQ